MPRFLYLLLGVMIGSSKGYAQETPLTLQHAWIQARTHNYSLRLATLQVERAAYLAQPGMAGLRPTLDAFAGTNNSVNNTRQTLANGSTIENDAAAAFGATAGLDFRWVVWQGNAARFRYQQLQGQQRSQFLLRDQREIDLAADLTTAWLQAARAQSLLSVQDSNIARSQLRLELARARYEGGQWSKTEVLQAEVDLKADERALLQVKQAHRQVIVQLADQMSVRAQDSLWLLPALMQPDTTLQLEPLWEQAQATQPSLLLARNEESVAELALREAQARRLPRLEFNAGPVLNYVNNPASFVTQNRNLAFTYGLNMSLPLYQGNQLKQQQDIRRLEKNLRTLEAEAQELAVYNRLMAAWQGYQLGLEQLRLERNVVASARENQDLAEERYRLGRGTQLDLRQAQVALVQAQAAELDARFQVLLFQTELLRLAGTLPQALEMGW
ncbi:MAG: TolC family protein [Bacteroidetes bacterium]|nr:TolC family protein [Bacteroidota bacterium]